MSSNNFTVQETYFIQTSNDNCIEISGYLNLSYNNISKFQPIPTAEYKGYRGITVPLGALWVITSGNKIFSVVNLVKAALNIDLNNINKTKLANINERNILILHTLTMTFSYLYDCNCDMLKYLELQRSKEFKRAFNKYEDMEEYLKFSNVKIYEFKISLNSLKCGLPTHLSGMYLYNIKETELQCENALCTEKKYCICIETPYNKTVRINCTNAKLDYKPFLKRTLHIWKYIWDLTTYKHFQTTVQKYQCKLNGLTYQTIS